MIPLSRFAISICNGKKKTEDEYTCEDSASNSSVISFSATDSTGEFPKCCVGRPSCSFDEGGRIFKGPIDRGIRIICSGIYPTVTRDDGDDDSDRDRLGRPRPAASLPPNPNLLRCQRILMR